MKKTVLALVAASSLALSACNSGDAASSDGKLHIALISSLESPTTSLPWIEGSVEAAVDAINDAGGVNGQKIEVSVCNDKATAEDTRRCIQEAARDSQTLAVVGLVTPFGAEAWPILESSNLPALAPAAIQQVDLQSPMSYPLDPGSIGLVGFPQVAKSMLDAKTLVPIHLDEAFAGPNQASFEKGAELAGVELASAIKIPTDAVDYAPFVARAEESGADAILAGMTAATLLKLWQALSDAGSDLKIIATQGTVTQDVLKEAGPAAEGSIVVSGSPLVSQDTETGAQFIAEMEKYQPDEDPLTAGSVGMRAWAAVHMFADVAASIDGDVTRESFVKALDGLDGENIAWLENLSYTEEGPVEDAPRLTSWTLFPSEVKDSKQIPLEPFDPFQD